MKQIDFEFIYKNKSLFKHKKAVFIVGAGISVSSGIPDFRSTSGIFSTLKKELKTDGMTFFSYHFGLKKETRMTYLKYISDLKNLCDSASPNIVHKFLTNYPRSRIYTQNIDCLESKAGMVFKKDFTTRGVYLHGNLSQLVCQYCGFKTQFGNEDIVKFKNKQEVECVNCANKIKLSLLNNGRTKPLGIMHPGIIHYHQAHPDAAFIGKIVEKDLNCDLLIVIGTSLKVEGVKKIVKRFASSSNVKGKRFLINLTKPTKEWEDVFDYFFEGDCNQFVQVLDSGFIKEKCDANKKFTKDISYQDKLIENISYHDKLIQNTPYQDKLIENISYHEVEYKNEKKLSDIEKKHNTVFVEVCNDEILTENEINITENKLSEIEKTHNTVFAEVINVVTNNVISAENEMKNDEENVIETSEELLNDKNSVVASIKRISLCKIDNTTVCSGDNVKNISYLSEDKYDVKLLKEKEITKPQIYAKLQKLNDVFKKEENIILPILDEVLATSQNSDVKEILDTD